MKRFENAELGDRVWSDHFKEIGVVESILSGPQRIAVNFGTFGRSFTVEGLE